MPVTGDTEARAYLVSLTDGRRDLWIAGSPDGVKKVNISGLPDVTVHGRLAVIRFDASGEVAFINASGASRVTAGAVNLAGPAAYYGTVRKVDDALIGSIAFDVDWQHAPEKALQGPLAVLTRATNALPANWTALNIDGSRIRLAELRSFFSRCKLEQISGKAGVYRPLPNLVQLYTPHSKGPSAKIVCGKFVCKDGKTLGVIRDMTTDESGEALLHIQDPQGNPLTNLHQQMVDLQETVSGCKVEVVNNLFFRK